MKKLLFSAMACIAFAGSAFASNEEALDSQVINNINEDSVIFFDNCNIKISYRNSKGELIHAGGTQGTVESYKDCREILENNLAKFISWGYEIESYTLAYGETHEI